jgi:hypothetical protein
MKDLILHGEDNFIHKHQEDYFIMNEFNDNFFFYKIG